VAASKKPAERRVLEYERRARLLLWAATTAMFGGTLLLVAILWLLSQAVSRVFIDGDTLSDVSGLLEAMLALAVARSALIFAGEWLTQCSANRLKARLRGDLMRHLMDLGPAFSSRERSGELTHTALQGVEDLDEYVTTYQPLRMLAALVPAAVVIAVLLIDPVTVVILLLTGPVLVLLLAMIGGRARELTERRFEEMSWMSASLLDLLQGLTTLKLFGRSRDQAQAVREVSQRHGDTTMQVLRTAFETSFVLEMCSALAVALVAVEVSLRLVHGGLPFASALAVLVITPEFFLPLRQLSTRYHAGATGRAAAQRIFGLLDEPLPPQPVPVFHQAYWNWSGDIRFERVSYAYEPGREALTDVSITIPAGRTLALVGETGSGKSTVASLLLHFIEPDQGEVTVGGMSIAALEGAVWRADVAWVPQRPHLFHGTVLENITLARPSATLEEVMEAARAAHAHEFILRLPKGYETQIGENGAQLSGGEQQRLAVARAFLKDAPILILDEPTSHLDSHSEALVIEALATLLKGRTALLIAHRRDLLELADDVAVLHQGRIVESSMGHDLPDRAAPHEVLAGNPEGTS
jgi:ATP-binding cassette subfamily C protein CydD